MEHYYNKATKTMHMHSTNEKRFHFVLSIRHKDDECTVESVELKYPAFTANTANGPQEIGSVHMTFRVVCWGEIFYRLTRGIEIPKNWFAHNEA